MSRKRRSTKPTQETCYYREADQLSCSASPQWKLATEHGNSFRVCDTHLAWGLRFSGLPALVAEYGPVTVESIKRLQRVMKNEDEES